MDSPIFLDMRAYSIFSIPEGFPDSLRKERKRLLAKLALAWLVMMQAMMFAFPGYLRSESMAPDNLQLLDQAIVLMNWSALVLTIPVMAYCASPIWKGVGQSVRGGYIGMDIPVALGIIVAFVPSVVNTWYQQGEVYFESVSMFVAFLLTARYLELCARQSLERGHAFEQVENFRTTLTTRANRIAFWFVLIQVLLALACGAIWYVYEPSHAVAVMVSLFVMSCPCAMSMAVPTAVAATHSSLMVVPVHSEHELHEILQKTNKVAKQNLYGSVAWHLLMTPLAAIGLVSPWVAAVSMLLSSLLVAFNSWRLYRQRVLGANIPSAQVAA